MLVHAKCIDCGFFCQRATKEDGPLTPCKRCGGKVTRVTLFDKRMETQKRHIELDRKYENN